MSQKMFAKLNGYIEVMEDNSEPLQQRIKSYKSANCRIKKIRKEIEKTATRLTEYEPVSRNLTVKDWNGQITDLDSKIEKLSDSSFSDAVAEYQNIVDTIASLEKLLTKQEISVQKIVDNGTHLEPIDIPEFVNKEEIISALDSDE